MSDPRRKVLREAVSLLLIETGFTSATEDSLETMVEMLQALLSEIGLQTKNYAELAGRTQAVVGDVLMALINLGISFKDLDKYAHRETKPVARPLNVNQAQKPLQILQAGTKQSNPVHIPSYLPQLPDPHAYVRTATYKQPETEYEAIREKSANQKRDIERALTKFLAKTCTETHNLFDNEEIQMFPLIASKPSSVPAYLAALNPCDQIFDFEELEYYYLVANRKPDDEKPDEQGSEDEEKREQTEDADAASPPKKKSKKAKDKAEVKKEAESTSTTRAPTPEPKPAAVLPPPEEKVIDNPFLKLKPKLST